MSKSLAAMTGALALLLLLPSCGPEQAGPANSAAAAEENAPESALPADPARPGAPVDSTSGPIPPPDAVSHPNGYLPPAPAESEPPAANSSGTDPSPPATEDQYIRDGQ
jgi:hypothetical protein